MEGRKERLGEREGGRRKGGVERKGLEGGRRVKVEEGKGGMRRK